MNLVSYNWVKDIKEEKEGRAYKCIGVELNEEGKVKWVKDEEMKEAREEEGRMFKGSGWLQIRGLRVEGVRCDFKKF